MAPCTCMTFDAASLRARAGPKVSASRSSNDTAPAAASDQRAVRRRAGVRAASFHASNSASRADTKAPARNARWIGS